MSKSYKYYIIHKPYKILSQFTDEGNNAGLGSIFHFEQDIYPVGRLDLDSEGLLILTNDKALNQRLLHPKNKHKRTYWALVEGMPSEQNLSKFKNGLDINLGKGKKYHTIQAEVKTIANPNIPERVPSVNYSKSEKHSWLEIQLTEGKNRQVRKMTAAIGHPTLRLIRVSIEELQLYPLQPGEKKLLNRELIYRLLHLESGYH